MKLSKLCENSLLGDPLENPVSAAPDLISIGDMVFINMVLNV